MFRSLTVAVRFPQGPLGRSGTVRDGYQGLPRSDQGLLKAARTKRSSEKYLFFNPGLIFGGTTIHYDKASSEGMASGKSNVIASHAMARGDLRFLTTHQKRDAEKRMAAILKQHLPGTTASMTFQDGFPRCPERW
jgi:glutamate carboxypeptidase